MMNQILSFADKHSIVATVLAVTALGFAVVGYKLVALVVDTLLALLGRPRTVLRRQEVIRTGKRAEPATTAKAEPEHEVGQTAASRDQEKRLRAAFKDLGYAKCEYEPVMRQLDLSESMDTIIRKALAKLQKSAN